MNVTKAGVDDLEDLLRLAAEYQEGDETVSVVDDAKNAEHLKSFLSDHDAAIFIGRTSSGQPIGFASVCLVPSTLHASRVPHLLDLFISESYRQQGFGRQLFQHALRWAKSRKYPKLTWLIGSMNMPAQYLSDSVEGAVQSGWLSYWLDLENK